MKLLILVLFVFTGLTLASTQIKLFENRKSLIPLNFNEAIKSIQSKLELSNKIKEYQFDNLNILDLIDESSAFNSLNAPFPLPNVSSGCLSQFSSFAFALSSRQTWAIQGNRKNEMLHFLNLNFYSKFLMHLVNLHLELFKELCFGPENTKSALI